MNKDIINLRYGELDTALSEMSDEDLKSFLKYADNEVAKYTTMQLAKKVMLNSAYGALGNVGFRFFDIRNAEAITATGQLSLKWMERKLNEYFNALYNTNNVDYVIYGDTDSLYIDVSQLVDNVMPDETDKDKITTFLSQSCEVFEGKIAEYYQEMADMLNCREQQFIMDREVIASTGFWTKKKRYALLVHDNEGERYETPKLKIMGMETQKSSTPEVCRNKLKEGLTIILERGDEGELQKFVKSFKSEFYNMNPETIGFPSGITEIDKWVSPTNGKPLKGCPIHVRASIVHNTLAAKNELRVKDIEGGDNLIWLYLKKPNPSKNHVVGFTDGLPVEFKLHKYIDYATQFEKSFLKPLTNMCDAIGWSPIKRGKLF